MQLYQAVQQSIDSIGISPKLKAFNQRALLILVMTTWCVILEWIFLNYEADSAEEYMKSIYTITAGIGAILCFTSTILIRQRLFSLITMHNASFNESK